MSLEGTKEGQISQADDLRKPDEHIDPEAGRRYWENAAASNVGMLGGIPTLHEFSHISRTDIIGSRAFLARLGIGLKGGRSALKSAVDGGAGYVSRNEASFGLC